MTDAGHITGKYGRSDAQLALAISQHGVFSLAQLTELGFTATAVHKRAGSGRLHRIHRGVYGLAPPELLTLRARYMAAVLACGPDAVLSHRSAAALHELGATHRGPIDVTVPGRTARRIPGIEVHRSLTLGAADITVVDGIPCTAVARTLLDLAGMVSGATQERALVQADVTGRLDVRALQDQLERNAHAPSAGRLRVALDQHIPGTRQTESRLEDEFLALCRDYSLPPPETQVRVTLQDGAPAIRADFTWRAHRLIVETDGSAYHRTRRAFENDRRRDQRLILAGWRVVRITWRQISDTPAVIARLVAELLASSVGG